MKANYITLCNMRHKHNITCSFSCDRTCFHFLFVHCLQVLLETNRWIKWRACDVGEAKEGLENEQWRRWSNRKVGECAVTYVKRWKGWRMSCDVGELTERLDNELCYDYNYELCSFSTFPSLHLCHNSFSKPSVALPTSQLILQTFRRFTNVTTHSPTLPSLYLRHSSFSNLSVASPTSQFIFQPLFRFSYVTSSLLNSSFSLSFFLSIWNISRAHSPTFQSLNLRHNSFSNPSVALPTSQLILQPFRCFTYVTVHSPTLLSLLLRHKLFT